MSVTGLFELLEQADDFRCATRIGEPEDGPAVEVVLLRLQAGFRVKGEWPAAPPRGCNDGLGREQSA